MRTSQLTGLRLVASTASALAMMAVLVLLGHGDTAHAADFGPEGRICLDNETTIDPDPLIPFPPGDPGGHAEECDGDNSAGAISGVTSILFIPEGHSNFGGIIGFTPPEWTVARDDDVIDGALVGQLDSRARLGFLNNPCNNSLPVRFVMMDATTDPSTTVPFKDPQLDLDPPDGPDKDDDPQYGPEPDDQFDIGPDGLPLGVTRYPDYLLRIRPDLLAGTPALPVPIARLYGQTEVGGIDVSLNFLLFEPGEQIGEKTMAPGFGYPSVTILQSAGDPDPVPDPDDANAITDFCSPLQSVTTTFAVTQDNPNTAANEGGVTYRTNPSSDGTFNFITYARSQRDADNDGIENSLDPCPFDPTPNWDPRSSSRIQPGEDSDGDGIPDVCDEKDDQDVNAGDHDLDVYYNRVDICPLVPNGRRDSENQEDTDFDSIGDVCDPNPNTPDGERTALCLVTEVVIGAGGTAPEVKGQPCTEDVVEPTPTVEAGAGTPTPDTTPTPGATPLPSDGGAVGGAGTGVGALAPAASSVPIWAAIASGLGVTGILGAIGATLSRIFRRRQRG